MKDPTKIFRKVALERLASPEQLDQLLTVTSPRGWLALTGIVTLLVAALVWGVIGSIPTQVRGTCMLMTEAGITRVLSPSNGTLKSLYGIQEGDNVVKGQKIAVIDQPEMRQNVENTENDVKVLKRRLETKKKEFEALEALEGKSAEKRKLSLATQIDAETRRLAVLKDRVESIEDLYQRNLVSQTSLLQSREELITTETRLEQAKIQLTEIDLEFLKMVDQHRVQLFTLNQQISENQERLLLLETQLSQASTIEAPFDGQVTSLPVREGVPVAVGQELVSIEINKGTYELTVSAYFLPGDGKRVKPNMTVQVAPATVKPEEFGYMVDKVESVSAFPVSTEKLMNQMGNENLVKSFLGKGDPIMVIAHLQQSKQTPSGFVWTSKDGPPHGIYGGTVCKALVTVHEQPPITLVIPTLKKFLGLA